MDLKIIAQEIREIIKEKQKELELTFEEDAHKYTMKDLDGKVRSDFPSVSKVMKLFYDEFPTEEAAYKKAKGDPYEAQQLMEEWAKAGTTSTNMGSRVHFELETETLSMFNVKKEVRQPVYECDMEMTMKGDRMINAGKKFLKLMKERGAILLDTEIVLGHPELGYTGQPDKFWLMFNKCQNRFADEWVTLDKVDKRKKGRVEYTVPVFKFDGVTSNDDAKQADQCYDLLCERLKIRDEERVAEKAAESKPLTGIEANFKEAEIEAIQAEFEEDDDLPF